MEKDRERKCHVCDRHLTESSWVVGFRERGPAVPVAIMSRQEFEQGSQDYTPEFQHKEACRLKCVADLIRLIRSGEPLDV